MLSTNSGRAFWDKISHSPYVITSDKMWISYDDQDSIRAKVKYVRESQYAGEFSLSQLLIWSRFQTGSGGSRRKLASSLNQINNQINLDNAN